ncbi:hypothetical protein [Oceanobacillus kimchii]|uniref:Uncharacterized protein n=1 Tax=Oceanobacillus kimchii TaxID=746691 RepID=A0ABQ5TNQ3_9BACI|nr:hypothetical protein [Oceanobacillus kimchii]GLO66192.1 hypothetical protein MACH08_19760 [Oceanobacillus kimchii]
MESSEQIRRMLEKEQREQKRIGSNVHRRTGKGSYKARVAGGVVFAKNNFKRYEKNSKIKKYEMSKLIVPIEDFEVLSHVDQVKLMELWLLRNSKKEICEQMGIGRQRLNKLILSLGVDPEKMILTEDQLNKYKVEVIPSDIFRKIDDSQKFELVKHYNVDMGLTNNDIANRLDYPSSTFNSYKTRWKKAYDKKEEAGLSLNNLGSDIDLDNHYEDDGLLSLDDEIESNQSNKSSKSLSENSYNSNDSVERQDSAREIEERSFSITVTDILTTKELTERIEAIATMTNPNKRYKVMIKMEEK